jgi:hypothetical protein
MKEKRHVRWRWKWQQRGIGVWFICGERKEKEREGRRGEGERKEGEELPFLMYTEKASASRMV